MLSSIQRNIIIKAVKIRMDRGEDIHEVLESYSRLTDDEREEVMASIGSMPQ